MTNYKFDFVAEKSLLDDIQQVASKMTFDTGDVIVPPDKYIKVIPLVISGTIKVLREDDNGNELFLYYISSGQSCAVSLSTCITQKLSNIKAIAEEKTDLLAIPVSYAIQWFNQYPSWRNFVLRTMDARFDNLITAIDTLAFSKLDDRLIAYLNSKYKALKSKTINITHQAIANELSTTREMISRLLKNLEKKGMVRLFRNKIEIINLMC